MSYRIAVVDDCATDTEYVQKMVEEWLVMRNETAQIKPFPSAEAFLFTYEDNTAWDILLLDIEMKEMNGMELAKKLRESNSAVQLVFITGYPDFMAEGYEVSALHYLMKPVSKEKLQTVLDKAVTGLTKSEKMLSVTFDRQTDLVPLSRILYIEAQKQYVLIHTEEKEYRMKASLTEMKEQTDEFFFPCQRSFLVNLRHVVRIKSDCVVLKSREEVPISRGMAEKIGREMIRLF